jgi:hypothetical protein
MLSILVVLAGFLIGADTGLLMRRTPRNPPAPGTAAYFPTLSVTSALIAGISLAEASLLVLLEHVPELAGWIAGPLLALFGFVWCHGGILEHRLQPLRADEKRPPDEDWDLAGGLPLRQQLGLGLRMGLLLPAAGVRTVPVLTISILIAIAAATAPSEMLRTFSSPRVRLSTVVRTATGALLCALGVGTEIERLSQGTIPALQVALPLAVFAWGACAIALWRSPNR